MSVLKSFFCEYFACDNSKSNELLRVSSPVAKQIHSLIRSSESFFKLFSSFSAHIRASTIDGYLAPSPIHSIDALISDRTFKGLLAEKIGGNFIKIGNES
jgi:hypothetical protein